MDDWQNTLTEWIAGARLVVAAAGATEGLRWELAEVDRVGVMDRLLVVIAPGHDPPTDVGPLTLARPEALNHSIPPARIRAIVPRVEDHDAVYVVSDGHRDIDVEVATEVGAALVRARASSLDTAPERPVAAAHERAQATTGPLAHPSVPGFPAVPYSSTTIFGSAAPSTRGVDDHVPPRGRPPAHASARSPLPPRTRPENPYAWRG
jgi:hypothetical protein